MKRGGMILALLGVLVVGAIVYGAVVKFEGRAPEAGLEPALPEVLGLENSFRLTLTDQGQGLKSVQARITQGDKVIDLAEHRWPGRMVVIGSGTDRAVMDLSVPVRKLGLKDGPAVVSLDIRDHSWRESFHGNRLLLERKVEIDTQPPILSLTERANYFNLGGMGLAVFKANEPVTALAKVGELSFPALPLAGQANLYEAFLAVPYDLAKGTAFAVEAKDRAGNQAVLRLPVTVKPRRWRQSQMNVSDGFLSATVPEFRPHYPDLPQNDLEAYIVINRQVRDLNNAAIQEATAPVTPERLWSGPFLQMPNSARTAGFADHRIYLYNGKEIDRQIHMGIDLASLAQAKVPAANAGKVVYAEYLGIYGNCVILDHGQGLYSLYGHLSNIMVAKGQSVNKGQDLGQTGMTGLAGGDHLHYSIICHGVFVDPVEWYDPHWINDNITAKEENAVQGG